MARVSMSREDQIAAATAAALAWGPSFVAGGVRSPRGLFGSVAACETAGRQVLVGRPELGVVQVSYYGVRLVDSGAGLVPVTGFHVEDVGVGGPLPVGGGR
jgi:hypothetical protein